MNPDHPFTYNPASGRWAIGERELHCGDCFQLWTGQKWEDTRIEMSRDHWYLVGLPDPPNDYRDNPARLYS